MGRLTAGIACRPWQGPRRGLATGLGRRWLRHTRRDDRGAIGVIVAVMIGAGVLVGMGALVVDVGQIYQIRAEAQNGADAAAIAVADSCAQGTCNTGLATTYADDNSHSGKALVDTVCGAGGLGTCSLSTGGLTDCPANPKSGTNYVDVVVTAETSGGATLIPPTLAGGLAGGGSYKGTTVNACAQAEWGGALQANAVAFTISACEWDADTSDGTSFAPSSGTPAESYDQALVLHGDPGGGCATEPSGADGPGMFGWTADQTGTCQLYVNGSTYDDKPGVSVTGGCKTALAADQADKTVIYIPVYTSTNGGGDNGYYNLKGFAAFVVTGYSLPGFFASDWLNPDNNCHGSSKCINGYFTQGLISAAPPLGNTYLGAAVVQITG